jgi:hypothetical protein
MIFVHYLYSDLYLQSFPTGIDCPSDKSYDKFNDFFKKLEDESKGLLCGEFWGGSNGADGRIEWTKPIPFNCHGSGTTVRDTPTEDIKKTILVQPGSIELECGYNSAQKTMWQLQGNGGIARWCYGQGYIIMMLRDPAHVRDEHNKRDERMLNEHINNT